MNEQDNEIKYNIIRDINTMFDMVKYIDNSFDTNTYRCYNYSKIVMALEQLESAIGFQATGNPIQDTVNNIILQDVKTIISKHKKDVLSQIKFITEK